MQITYALSRLHGECNITAACTRPGEGCWGRRAVTSDPGGVRAQAAPCKLAPRGGGKSPAQGGGWPSTLGDEQSPAQSCVSLRFLVHDSVLPPKCKQVA